MTKLDSAQSFLLHKYARLLTEYCLELREGESLYITSAIPAIPLIQEIYKDAVGKGIHVEIDLSFREQYRILIDYGTEDVISRVPILKETAIKDFDAYLSIRAPFNVREDQNVDPIKSKARHMAFKNINDLYFKRTADGNLKRTLCQYPTDACAQEAGMSLEEYSYFVYNACMLYADDPAGEWRQIRRKQQKLVDFLNEADKVTYQNAKSDITFSVKGRKWINSDGRTNMPSGEVFTGPIENSVQGIIHFDYPSIFMGKEVQGITLEVKDGMIVYWDAQTGKDVLDRVFDIEGSRYFGEVAIGTNYNILSATKNILFDEKIGGTIHMAIGQSYLQTGGTNQSPIHWDMIANMMEDGEIIVDGEIIYRKGHFLNGLLDH